MKKYIVLSVNDNPGYLIHVPLVFWAWKKIGWQPIVFYHGEKNKIYNHVLNACDVRPFYLIDHGYKSETVTQVSRLYASCIAEEKSYLMTGDIDMMPLSDYWHPLGFVNITAWGHDLTGFVHYPICYIGMTKETWDHVMNIDPTSDCDYNHFIKRDLDTLPQAKSENKTKRWVTDQDLITERINNSGISVHRIKRGTKKNGYAKGRVDRSAWNINEEGPLIDCHMFQDIHVNEDHYNKTLQLLYKVWPNEDFKWYEDYVKGFKALL
jgi:hypothetical protein